MAKKRRRYSQIERKRIIAAVERDGLTYAQASKKFGVSAVTLWKWRKKAKTAPRERSSRRVQANGSLVALVRAEVQAGVREVVTGIVRAEVGSYLQRVGPERGRR